MAIKLENGNSSSDHSGFDDSNYVTVDEETKLKKKFTIIMIVALTIGTLIFFDILITSKTDFGPFLAIKVKTHDDGGTKEYYGLGYKVIKYRVNNGRHATIVGSWTLKYDPISRVSSMEELAFSFRNDAKTALNNSYKQFFKVTGVVDSVDKKNNKITLIYEDEDGGSYNMKADFYLKSDSKINDYNEGDILSIYGTFIKYTPQKGDAIRTLTFENCSIA